MLGISWRYTSKVFSGFFLNLGFSLGIGSDFLISPYIQLLFNVLVFSVCLLNGKKEKNKKKGGCWPSKSPESASEKQVKNRNILGIW